MPKIRVLISVAGQPAWKRGDVVEVDEATAAAWCDGVRAERVAGKPQRSRKVPENAARPGPPEDAAGPVSQRSSTEGT